jgi:4-carboxymuconolactone decarboxylase
MLMLHAGYPSALEALRLLNDAWPGQARRTREGRPKDWRVRGTRLCARVYGPVFPKLLATVRALHPDLAEWMVEHGYGRVLSRRGLSARDRELVTVAVLAATGWERQLHSHLLGARRCGAPLPAVRAAFETGLSMAQPAARAGCRSAWRAVFDPPKTRT